MEKLQAQRQAGLIASQSIDPVTQQFDPSRFNASIAKAGPQIAMAAQQALQDASTLSSTQVNQQHMKIGYINGALGALPDTASRDDVIRSIQNGSMAGFTPTEIQNEISKYQPMGQAWRPTFSSTG